MEMENRDGDGEQRQRWTLQLVAGSHKERWYSLPLLGLKGRGKRLRVEPWVQYFGEP